ncbi:VanW family protein [Bacillus salacetis]|uniref:VanW family protein n=1 Tax=Bacillus salacetis TaxID=2315464 RepID=UPI003B9E2369
MENRPFKKVFFPLLSATVFIFGFSHAGSFALDKFTEGSVIKPSTKVASIDIGGQPEQQAKEALAQAVADWKATAVLKVELSGEETLIDLSVFHIDINKSFQSVNEGGVNPLAVSLDSDMLMQQLTAAFPDMKAEEMETEAFQQDLISQASMLPSDSVISLSNYFPKGSVEEVTAEALSEKITITPEIKRFIDTFPEIAIKQGSDFSFLQNLEDKGFSTDQDLSLITSLLYKLILKTNFTIIERNTSQELPKEVELGYEAKVDASSHQDFVFANPNKTDYVIQLELLNNQIYAQLIGFPLATDYKVSLKDKEEFPPKKIVQYNPFLEKNVVRVQEEGSKGVLIKVFRQSIGENGEVLAEEQIAEDFYPPVHRIEIRSLEEAPEDVEETDIIDTPLAETEDSDSEGTNGPPPNSGSSEEDAKEETGKSSDNSDSTSAASTSGPGTASKSDSNEKRENK